MNRVIWAIVLGLAFFGRDRELAADEPSGLAAAAAIEDAFVKAIESAEKSVVSISRDRVQPAPPASPFGRNEPPFRFREPPPSIKDVDYIPNQFGAGIVLDENGLILTNYHLVRGGPIEGKADSKSDQTLYVRLPDRRGFEAHIFAADPRCDLAVLKIAANDLKPIRLGNASRLRKGQFVIALGNPYLIARDGSASASWGIVGNLTRQAVQNPALGEIERRRTETIQNLGVLIQVDTRLELGTSGGALLNLQGELVGITTSLASIVGYEKSAGFAMPVDDSTRRIIETLRQGKEVEYGFLGISPVDVTDADLGPLGARLGQFGAAEISTLGANLPADRGGVLEKDLVLRVNEKPILSRTDLMREIGLLAPGTVARIRVWRPQTGKELDLPVELGKWPVLDEEGMVASVPVRDPWRGIVYDYATARNRSFKAFENPPERNVGALVLDVLLNSPAAAAELRPLDLITGVKGKPVRSPREFQELVRHETGPVPIQFLSGASSSERGDKPVPKTVEIRPR